MVPRQLLLETSATASSLGADSKKFTFVTNFVSERNLVGRQLV